MKEKNILIFASPAAKSHQFILDKIALYSKQELIKTKNIFLKFHVLAHEVDKLYWENSGHIIYTFGNTSQFQEIFKKI